MENNNTQNKITFESDDYKLTLNHEDLSNDHLIEFLEWSIRVLEVRDAKRVKKSLERLIYAFKAMTSFEKSLDEQAEGERISHNPEPDKKLDEKKPIEENKRTLTIVTKFKSEHFELLETVLKSSAEIKRLQEENNLLLRKCFDRNSIQVGERFSAKKETT